MEKVIICYGPIIGATNGHVHSSIGRSFCGYIKPPISTCAWCFRLSLSLSHVKATVEMTSWSHQIEIESCQGPENL